MNSSSRRSRYPKLVLYPHLAALELLPQQTGHPNFHPPTTRPNGLIPGHRHLPLTTASPSTSSSDGHGDRAVPPLHDDKVTPASPRDTCMATSGPSGRRLGTAYPLLPAR